MTRTLSTTNAANTALKQPSAVYIVELGFTLPRRVSSGKDITYNTNLFSAVAEFDCQFAHDGLIARFSWFKDDYNTSDELIGQGTAGITAEVWVAYTDNPVDADFDKFFDGELGRAVISNNRIQLQLVPPQQQYTPRYYVTTDNFKHLTPEGTQFLTSNGVVILKRRM